MERSRFLCFIFLCSLIIPVQAIAKRPKPLIWNINDPEQIKTNPKYNHVVTSTLATADSYCEEEPITIVGVKYLHFAPSEHYFCSMGPYRWPDINSPSGYVLRDGVVNPDWNFYDSAKLTIMALRCKKLSEAFYYSKDIKYYSAFVRQLRAWFVDEQTLMLPNFEYSQVIPGQNDNKGTSSGMIDAYVFNTLIESIRLVECEKRIDSRTYKAVRKWFKSFGAWAEDTYGDYFSNVNNNISLAFDVTLLDIYIFTGEKTKVKTIIKNFTERRINTQIKEDGSQPEELKRTRAFFYSVYNLTHIIDFCYLARNREKDFYSQNGQRVDKAFEYLGQYIENTDEFPYQQITSWETCKKDYVTQLERVKRLRENN